MNDNDLYSKASYAAQDYRTVHGCYPDKIGIHHERLRRFRHRSICFMEPTELPTAFYVEEHPTLDSLTFRRHMAMFEPVVGMAIEYDEVYLPIPGEEYKVMSSEQIAAMARQKERDEKFYLATGRRLLRR